jgi:hypothetical protein
MPKQAVYTLASREGASNQKEELIANYQGETKEVLLQKIRVLFPLAPADKRRQKIGEGMINTLERLLHSVEKKHFRLTDREKEVLQSQLTALRHLIERR